MRLARDAGDISSLFPTGITSLLDAPHTFVKAVRTALFFLSFENLPEAEQPPKRIWLDEKAMKAHWAQMNENRAAKRHGFDLDHMPQNEYAKDLLRQRGG